MLDTDIDLEKLSFKKHKGGYYYVSNLLLNKTNDFLIIQCESLGDELLLTDNAQLLSEYDSPDINLGLLEKIVNDLTTNLNLINNHMSICKKVKGKNIKSALSDLIKGIVIIENELEQL